MLTRFVPLCDLQQLCFSAMRLLHTLSVLFIILAYAHSARSTPVTPPGGSIRGKVTFKGAAPKLERAKCVTPEVCGATHGYDRLVLDHDGGVAYSLVYLKNPPAGRASFAPPLIKQSNCTFEPHMTIASRGSSVTFENDDAVLHNCHGYYFIGADRTTVFNDAQPLKGQRSQEQLRRAGMVNVECDAGHTWMSAWVWVTDSPFAAVTDEHGNFSIDGVPPGTYTLVMWHEGWKVASTRDGRPVFGGPILFEHEVTVPAVGATETSFELH